MKKKFILILISFITLVFFDPCLLIAQSTDKSKLQQFENAITQAEQYLKVKDYAKAKAEYQKALTLNPDAKYPKDKLAEIRKVYIDPLDETKFAQAIIKGDELLSQKNFFAAKEQYLIAVNIKPEDRIAREKLQSAEKLAIEFDLKRNEFNTLIEKADKLFVIKDYSGAKTIYEQAASLNTGEHYPSTRISEIDALLKLQEDLNEKYNKYISDADNAYMNKNFKMAIFNYREALKIKPVESYPKNMISRVEESFNTYQNNNKAYVTLISEADVLYNKKDYTNAMIAYQNALKLKPDEKYPAEMIEMANSILVSQEEVDSNYNKAIAEGDQLHNDNKMEGALKLYQQASLLKPDEKYPRQKIDEINNQLLDERNKIESKYTDAIEKADNSYNIEEFDKAIEYYQLALTLKGDEIYPKEAIEKTIAKKEARAENEREFNEILAKADKEFKLKDYENANIDYSRAAELKPNNMYVLSRLDNIKELTLENEEKEHQYSEFIAEADNLSNSGQFEEAINKYNEIIALFPEKVYPKTKVAEVIKIVSEQKAAEKKLAEERKLTEDRINQLLAEAEEFFENNDYKNALLKYQLVKQVRPGDDHVEERIDLIKNKLDALSDLESQYTNSIQKGDQYLDINEYTLAENEFKIALRFKPDDFYSRSKLNEIARIVEEKKVLAAKQANEKRVKDAQLEQIKKEADALFAKNDLNNALYKYKYVQLEIPDDKHVIEMINNIQEQLKEIEELNAYYSTALINGDKYLNNNQLELAEIEFKKALELKPDEVAPKQKLLEINRLADEKRLIEARNVEEARAVQLEFNRLVQLADDYYKNKVYTTAHATYTKAVNLNSTDTYVQERINEISNIIAQQEYEASKSYNDAIEKGRQFYTEGDYRSAIVQYEIASSAKPLERLPKDMLLEINNILIERSKNNLALYNKLILVADEYYQSRVYDKALEEYEKSSAAYPGEQYPFKMINRIKKEMEERAIVDLVTNPFSLAAGLEKKFSFKSIEMRARKNNYILIKAKKTSEKPPKVFINYGVDSQKSGGIVMKGIDSNDTKEYLLRISIHDMWYRKDNNWISLYSEGGDIEIISLQISQGDIVNIQ